MAATGAQDPDLFWNSTDLFPAEYAGTIPIPLSPAQWSPGEYLAVILGSLLNGAMFVLVCWVVYDRNYRPIKAIQVPLFVAAMLGAFMFWFTDLIQLRILPQVGGFTGAGCTVFGIWLQYVFGIGLVISVICFRFIRLFRLIYQRKAVKGWKFNAVFFLLWSPAWVYAIAGTIDSANGPISTRGLLLCSAVFAFTWAIIAYLAVLAVVFLVLGILLSRLRARMFNEYREHMIMVGLLINAIIFYTFIVGLELHFKPWGRTLVSFMILLPVTAYFVLIAGRPVYNSIFRREAGLAEFNAAIEGKIVFTSDRKKSSNITDAGSSRMSMMTSPSGEMPGDTAAAKMTGSSSKDMAVGDTD